MRSRAVDDIVEEPLGGAHNDPDAAAAKLGATIRHHLASLKILTLDKLVDNRYERFRNLGAIDEQICDGKIVPMNEAAS